MNPAGSSTAVNKAGRNAAVTSLMVCCGFIVCFTPFNIPITPNASDYLDITDFSHNSKAISTLIARLSDAFLCFTVQYPSYCSHEHQNLVLSTRTWFYNLCAVLMYE